MAVAEIIGAAIGVMMLVIVAYVLVGSVLTAAEVVNNAQKDLTLLNEARLKTSISLNKSEINPRIARSQNFSVINDGNEIISDFNNMDIYTCDVNELRHNTYDKYSLENDGSWSIIRFESDIIHPNQLDPGEKMWVCATYSGIYDPTWFQVTTSNGVNAQTTIP